MQDGSRIALPFQFHREDIPYVPSHTKMTEMPTLTSAFTTRMTTREQARVQLEGTSMPRLTEEQLPTWMEYHEPDIYPDPHPLVDGGRTMADRLGPDSSIFGIGRPRYRAGADEFDKTI